MFNFSNVQVIKDAMNKLSRFQDALSLEIASQNICLDDYWMDLKGSIIDAGPCLHWISGSIIEWWLMGGHDDWMTPSISRERLTRKAIVSESVKQCPPCTRCTTPWRRWNSIDVYSFKIMSSYSGSEFTTNMATGMGTISGYHFKILVPAVAAGAIIGKGGETIAQLQKEAGARVKMSKSNDFYPGTIWIHMINLAINEQIHVLEY